MTPYILHHGDCLTVMYGMPDASVDSIVCDPPYELTSKRPNGRSAATEGKVMKGFMGMAWDGSGVAFNVDVWREALRVLKPGGHLLAFSSTRTSHRMVCAIEDAGFEIRDSIPWLYGSGFPKSQNISKAIDKKAGVEREVLAEGNAVKRMIPGADQDATGSWVKDNGREYVPTVTAAATPEAAQWEGWGTALKPAHEPCCMARKPLTKGMTVAANMLLHRTGGLNIDACRVEHDGTGTWGNQQNPDNHNSALGYMGGEIGQVSERHAAGRWPANIIHDGSTEVVALFPDSNGQQGKSDDSQRTRASVFGAPSDNGKEYEPRGDTGSAARFFYCAKASRPDRHDGLESPGNKFTHGGHMREVENMGSARGGNHHPTVKPTDLMAYLVRLVTPPGGLVLDPFMGSGSTGKACMREGFRFIGIDLSAEYVGIARARIEHEIAAVAARATAAQEAADLAARQIDLFAEAP
jgi:DNA modification methylase